LKETGSSGVFGKMAQLCCRSWFDHSLGKKIEKNKKIKKTSWKAIRKKAAIYVWSSLFLYLCVVYVPFHLQLFHDGFISLT